MKVKEESEKVDLKLNIQITKIMASGPITSWQIDGETMETVRDFILGGSKITADGVIMREVNAKATAAKKLQIATNFSLLSFQTIFHPFSTCHVFRSLPTIFSLVTSEARNPC